MKKYQSNIFRKTAVAMLAMVWMFFCTNVAFAQYFTINGVSNGQLCLDNAVNNDLSGLDFEFSGLTIGKQYRVNSNWGEMFQWNASAVNQTIGNKSFNIYNNNFKLEVYDEDSYSWNVVYTYPAITQNPNPPTASLVFSRGVSNGLYCGDGSTITEANSPILKVA